MALSSDAQHKKTTPDITFPLEVNEDYKKAEYVELAGIPYYNYYLKEPKMIQSYPLSGRFRVNPSGELYGFTLTRTFPINGTMIPGGSRYHRYKDDSYLITLSKDTLIQGYPVFHEEDGFIFWTENNVEFYIDGKIKVFGLSEDKVIQGIPCKASKFNRTVRFFRDGQLRMCCLSESIKIGGYPCYGGKENSELWLFPDGEVQSFYLSKDFVIQGKEYPRGTQIIFDENKNIHVLSGYLDFLSFYDDGSIHNCVLKDDFEIEGKFLAKGSRIIYSDDGWLEQIRPTKNILINGIPCRKNKFLGLYENGKLRRCNLSKKTVINGVSYNKGSWLNFNEEGIVKP